MESIGSENVNLQYVRSFFQITNLLFISVYSPSCLVRKSVRNDRSNFTLLDLTPIRGSSVAVIYFASRYEPDARSRMQWATLSLYLPNHTFVSLVAWFNIW